MPRVLELHADRGAHLERGRIASWAGLGPAAREDDPARRPVPARGGIPAIRFAAGDRLVVPDAPELHPGRGPFTVFVVASTRAVTAAHRIAHHGNTTSRDPGWSIFTEPSRSGLAVRFRVAGTTPAAQSHGYRQATELGARSIYELRLTGREVRARLGGLRMTDGGGGTRRRRYRGAVEPRQDLILGGGSGPFDLYAVVAVAGGDARELRRVRAELAARYPAERAETVADAGEPVTVFRWGAEAVSTRIPAIVRTNDGVLLAFAELRRRVSDAGHIGIGVKRSSDGGRTWSTVTVVADDGRNTSRNPVPIVDRRTGRVVLVSCWDLAVVDEHRVMAGSGQPSRVHVQHSDDGGLSWSRPRDITEQVRMPGWRWYATGPGAVEQLAGGRMLVPANHSDPAGRGPRHRSHVLFSDDGGETWALGGQVDAPGSNEAQLAQRPDGTVVLYMRNQAEGRKQLAVSRDDGLSWEPARRIPELVGTACQGDVIAVGDLLLSTAHQHYRLRRDLALNVSADGGATWPTYSVLAAGRAGYSDLVALPSGRVGVLMERDDDRIDYAELRLTR